MTRLTVSCYSVLPQRPNICLNDFVPCNIPYSEGDAPTSYLILTRPRSLQQGHSGCQWVASPSLPRAATGGSGAEMKWLFVHLKDMGRSQPSLLLRRNVAEALMPHRYNRESGLNWGLALV